jgi:SRSO17 transposase
LFLPEGWIKDEKRCNQVNVPEEQIVFKTKREQALEMIFAARKNGIWIKWVGFDSFYGDNPKLLRKLADNVEEFMGDIHSDHRIYYDDPKPEVPLPKSNKRKKPSKLQTQTRSIRVARWVVKQSPNAWKRGKIRESTKRKTP